MKKEKQEVPPIKSRSFLLWLARKNAKSILWPIGFALILTLLLLGVVSLIYCCCGNGNPVGKAFADIVSPVTVRNVAYESYGKSLPEAQFEPGQQKLVSVSNDERSVFWLSLAYFFGSVIFSGLLVATITNSLRTWADRVKQGTFRLYRISGHVVFWGYNDMVPGMIKHIVEEDNGLKRKRKIMVGVRGKADEIYNKICDLANLNDDECWRVVVFHVDGIYESHLINRLRVHRANDIYIIGEDDDAFNLNAYKKICEICERKKSDGWIPECYVQIRFQSTFALFQTYNKDNMAHFHAFNFHDEWARLLLTGKCLDEDKLIDCRGKGTEISPDSNKQVHLVIIGMTEMGEALAREAAFLCHYPNYVKKGVRTKITFIDPQAKVQMTYFTGRYHHLFDLCNHTFRHAGEVPGYPLLTKDFLDVEFEFVEANVADSKMRNEISEWANDEKQVLTIAVCSDLPHRSMASGLYLPDDVFDKKIPIWIYQPAKGDMGTYLGNSRFGNVYTFGMSGEQLDIKNEEIILQAKRLNFLYGKIYDVLSNVGNREMAEVLAAVDDLRVDYSTLDIFEWEKLDIFKKWSNIYSVSAIQKKKDSVQDNWTVDNVNIINQVEHNRWNVEKLLMGFRPTTYKQHNEIKTGILDKNKLKKEFIHDDIRPYAELDEITKKYDDKFTKEIPNIIGDVQKQL